MYASPTQLFVLAFCWISLLGSSVPSYASKQVALIIGNANYQNEIPLKNPINDAHDVAAKLTELGYDVEVAIDVSYNEMRIALAEFSQRSSQAEVALLYYAGHGIEMQKENYLIPIDATIKNSSQVLFQTIPLRMMTDAISGASKLRVIVLDACRNNPFLNNMKKSGGGKRSTLSRGLAAPPETGAGTVISFAAKEGTTASDGDGRNSPYAMEFLKYVSQENLDVGRMFRKIREGVLSRTNYNQEPFQYGSLPGDDIYLNPHSKISNKGSFDNTGKKLISTPPVSNAAKEAWEIANSANSLEMLQVVIDIFEDSIYAKFAAARIKKLEKDMVTQEVASIERVENTRILEKIDPVQDQSWNLAIYRDLDLFGADIYPKGIKADSIDDCSRICGRDLSCRAFTWNQKAKYCFPKTGYQFSQIFSGATSGLYYRGSQKPSIRTNWYAYQQSDLRGRDMGKSGDTTYESCLNSCQYNDSCKGFSFVYFTKINQCWLKNGNVSGPVYNRNAKKGVTSAKRVNQLVAPSRTYSVAARN